MRVNLLDGESHHKISYSPINNNDIFVCFSVNFIKELPDFQPKLCFSSFPS
jgi:hypothetical protein